MIQHPCRYGDYRWRPCTFALAFLQFVQAFGVTESGTFRFLPVVLPPLPWCLIVGEKADSEPVFPVEVFPADESGAPSVSMVLRSSDNREVWPRLDEVSVL